MVFGESRRGGGSNGELILAEDELADIRAADLRAALSSEAEYYETDSTEALVSLAPKEYIDPDYGPFGNIKFEWDGLELIATFTQEVKWPEDGDDEVAISQVRTLLRPLLATTRSRLANVETDNRFYDPIVLFLEIKIASPWRGRSVKDLYSVAEDATQLCDAFASSTVSRATVADLVRGGAGRLLVGQPEGNWLDAKAQEYDLTTLGGRISLAQSVSRFCNSEDGGLVVIGAKANKVPGGEVITKIRGVRAESGRDARYLQILNQLVYPPPFGLRIDLVPVADGLSLIVIDIPPQGEELKPFLVHGAIRKDGQVEGAYISIVQRRGEGSVPITAPMIHASLAAGRALLRGAVGAESVPTKPTSSKA